MDPFSKAHLLCFLLPYLFEFLAHSQQTLQLNEQLFEQFSEYAIRYKKTYAYITNSSEFLNRFQIFQDNIAHSKYMNRVYNNSNQPVYGINKFSDLTPQEFKELYLTGLKRNGRMSKQFASATTPNNFRNVDIPQKFDWRDKGVLTGIRDQGTCGACWSFSVVETMESMYAITYKTNFSTPELSVQQLIDCDDGNNGCKGGDICQATNWANSNLSCDPTGTESLL